MTEPLFDIRGNLTPYTILESTIEDVEKWFVLPFNETSTRHKLFKEYKRYTCDLRMAIGKPFYQWINGGFMRSVENPNDIDVVNYIDYESYEINEIIITSHFSKRSVDIFYSNLDAYTIRLYPPDHKNFLTFQADEAYWYDWFSKTRRDRSRKRYPKGFIQVKID